MKLDPTTLPDDPEHLRGVIAELLSRVGQLERDVDSLQQENRELFRKLFGRKSEKLNPGQYELVFEAMLDLGVEPAEVEAVEVEEVRRKRKVGSKPTGRRPLPAHLPRERRYEPVPPDQCTCGKCGAETVKIREETSEVLEYTPASFKVIEQVREVRGCKRCEESVVRAPKLSKPIDKGLPGPGLLAQVLTSKYLDHQPLYRQARIYARHGVELSRTTLCTWIAAAAEILTPLYGLLLEDLLKSRYIQTDDTIVPVLADQGVAQKGRLWVYLGDTEHPQVVYDYTPTRERDGPARLLKDFSGYLQADAYSGYDGIYAGGTVIEVACWAHARRYLYAAAHDHGDSRAYVGLAFVKQLFAIEEQARAQKLEPEDRLLLRQEKSCPVLEAMKLWMEEQALAALPKSALGRALTYITNQWKALGRFTESGVLSIDNNASERALRPVAIGRKNWLFAGSDAGAVRAAKIFSIIATAQRHGLEPFDYLRHLFSVLPGLDPAEFPELLPANFKRSRDVSAAA